MVRILRAGFHDDIAGLATYATSSPTPIKPFDDLFGAYDARRESQRINLYGFFLNLFRGVVHTRWSSFAITVISQDVLLKKSMN